MKRFPKADACLSGQESTEGLPGFIGDRGTVDAIFKEHRMICLEF